MATVYDLGLLRLRARASHGSASLLVVADEALYECVALREADAFEYTAPNWLALVRERVPEATDEELLRDNAEAPTQFLRGREKSLQHSHVFFHGLENFRVVSWDGETTLRLMFTYTMPDDDTIAFNTHVSMELTLLPIIVP